MKQIDAFDVYTTSLHEPPRREPDLSKAEHHATRLRTHAELLRGKPMRNIRDTMKSAAAFLESLQPPAPPEQAPSKAPQYTRRIIRFE